MMAPIELAMTSSDQRVHMSPRSRRLVPCATSLDLNLNICPVSVLLDLENNFHLTALRPGGSSVSIQVFLPAIFAISDSMDASQPSLGPRNASETDFGSSGLDPSTQSTSAISYLLLGRSGLPRSGGFPQGLGIGLAH